MLRPVWRAEMVAANERVSTLSVAETVVHARVRELWNDAMLLEEARAEGDSSQARLAIHREAIRVALSVWVPLADSAVHAWRRAPPLVQHVLAGSGGNTLLVERLLNDAPSSETEMVLGVARDVHRRALERFEADRSLVRQYARQWTAVWAIAAVVLVASLFGAVSLVQRWREPKDLAAGKPFTLSSSWQTCHPEQGECGGFPMKILFHTTEQANPWYQVDLGVPAPTFTSLTIRNRTDVAMARCLPLVAEVSDDGKTFKEIARRTETFVEWQPTFAPVTARYLRMRTDRVSTLHLEAVKVHP